MSSSTSIRGAAGRRVGILLLGLALACVGALSFAGSQAQAAPFSMDFDKGEVNLGFAFKGKEILPGPSSIPGSVSNPNFDPNVAVSAENPTTVVSPTGTPLFDYDSLDPTTFTQPGNPVTTPLNSFTPLGCGTPVTFGIYYAVPFGKTLNPADPTSIIWNPAPGNPFGTLLGQALANGGPPAGPAYYRVLNQGAILAAGEDPVTFPNPFNAALPDVTLTAPYPAENTLWQPYAAGPTGTPVGATGNTPFAGAAGLRFEQNTNPGFCPNPTDGSASGEIDAEGDIEIAPADFKMPVMVVPNPQDGSPVPITIETNGPITGKYTEATGALDLEGPLKVRVLTGLASNPLGSYCEVPLPNRNANGTGSGPLKLTSSYSLPTSVGFAGSPFDTISGPGALTGTWNRVGTTDPVISVGGASCGTVESVSGGLGGIWLSAGVNEPAPFPTCQDLGKVGTFPNCTDPVASLGSVTVTGPSKARRGKTVAYKVKVTNTGTATATGIRVAVSGRGVKVNTPIANIGPASSRTETIRVKFRTTGTVKATVKATSANAGTKSASKTIKVVK